MRKILLLPFIFWIAACNHVVPAVTPTRQQTFTPMVSDSTRAVTGTAIKNPNNSLQLSTPTIPSTKTPLHNMPQYGTATRSQLSPSPEIRLNPSTPAPSVSATAPISATASSLRFFEWSYEYAYAEVLPFVSPSGDYKEYELQLGKQKEIPGPPLAIDLAFSQTSNQVAYLTKQKEEDGGSLILWVADLGLQEVKQVWVDKDRWLGEVKLVSAYFESQMFWGIKDRYIFIFSFTEEAKDHMVVYDLKAGEIHPWIGGCDWISKLAKNNQFAVICQLHNGGQTSYAILGQDGISISDTLPESKIYKTLFWRFSLDGDRVLYVDENLQWRIIEKMGSWINLPLTYSKNDLYSGPGALSIQWSQDGKRVLVYGLEKRTDKLCPKIEGDIDVYDRACWFVLNSETGKFIWWPKRGLWDLSELSIPIENANLDFNMAMSPDGKWLAMTVADMRIGNAFRLIVTSTEDAQTEEIFINPFLLPTYYLSWYTRE